MMAEATDTSAETEVAGLLSALIRFDTSNPTGVERSAAEWVAELLGEVGLEPTILEAAPGRSNVVARFPGRDRSRPALLVQGHLDVVPAEPADWRIHPFSGEITDGYVWGRGAVDMKDMIAMVLAVVRDMARRGEQPERDLVLAFLADEEGGSDLGARWLIGRHPELFEDCSEAIGEVGGFSVQVSDALRVYPLQTAEKGLGWIRLTAEGTAGHGSMLHADNALSRLARSVARLADLSFPVELTSTMADFFGALARAGIELDLDEPEGAAASLGPMSRMIGAALRDTVNPTVFTAGFKSNVVPAHAEAFVDVRWLPGHERQVLAAIDAGLEPGVTRSWAVRGESVETSFDGQLVGHMIDAIRAEDEQALPLPYLMSGATDAKAFSSLGIRCFGFSPLQLPATLDFSALFHGVDERVPESALRFGVRVMRRLFAGC